MTSMMFDFENLALRCFYGNKDIEPESEIPNYDFWEFLTFNSIYRMLYKDRINEVILALDSQSWRKIVYPHYKAHRKKSREESKVNWDLYSERKNKFLDELKEFIPFKIISVNRAEADDILGTLVNFNRVYNPIIVSMDVDYMQLSKKARIYNPIKKEFNKPIDTEKFLLYSALVGQKKDNIFNVKTPWDWPETKKRPPMGEKGIDKLIQNNELESFLDTPIEYEFPVEIENQESITYKQTIVPRELYNINRKLIDFSCTPKVMADATINTYDNYVMGANPDRLYEYFRHKNWREMIDNYNQVESKLLELF